MLNRQPLSDQEIEDALAVRISYSMNDILLVDWNAALLVDSEGDDVRALLEFSNVELLEMRYVDQKLDRALDQAYETLARRSMEFTVGFQILQCRFGKVDRIASR